MSKRRTITLTETEYLAIVSAFAVWHASFYEQAESDKMEYDVPIPTSIKTTNRALGRILDKWHRAGR